MSVGAIVSRMTKCYVCPETAVGYVRWVQSRKKVQSYPVCLTHYLLALGIERFAQDWGRSELARAFGIKKGSIPKIEVSLTP